MVVRHIDGPDLYNKHFLTLDTSGKLESGVVRTDGQVTPTPLSVRFRNPCPFVVWRVGTRSEPEVPGPRLKDPVVVVVS